MDLLSPDDEATAKQSTTKLLAYLIFVFVLCIVHDNNKSTLIVD